MLSQRLKNIFWHPIRKYRIKANQKKVIDFWDKAIAMYENGNLPIFNTKAVCKDIGSNNVIWQYWGQGWDEENLPEVVRLSKYTVDKFCPEYKIIRLDDNNVKDYIEFPQFVYDKLNGNNYFNRTFFSDLLRIALLLHYGGLWMDATIMLTGELPDYIRRDFFVFQRIEKLKKKRFWERSYTPYWGGYCGMLSSFIYGQKGNVFIRDMESLMLYYWHRWDNVTDYFFFQLLFRELVKQKKYRYIAEDRVDDSLPHLLQTYVNCEGDCWIYLGEALNNSIHKLSYFKPEKLLLLYKILKERNIIIRNE